MPLSKPFKTRYQVFVFIKLNRRLLKFVSSGYVNASSDARESGLRYLATMSVFP